MQFRRKSEMVTPDQALPGRAEPPEPVPATHVVLRTPLTGPWPAGMQTVVFAMGCFWGAERKFWQLGGVHSTSVGYAGGFTPNPTYDEVCTGLTGHAEVVLVVFDPAAVSFERVLQVFWESHDPTQGMRQGADFGTQYRSAVYTTDPAQQGLVTSSLEAYQQRLRSAGLGSITTEVAPLGEFFYAEPRHQQYLAKNPDGYCGIAGTGVSCPISLRA